MIDDKETKKRFGYLGTGLTPGSNKRIVYLCSICGKAGDILRCYYKEGRMCLACAHLNRKIGQPAIKEDILRVTKLLGYQPTVEEYQRIGKYTLPTVKANFGKGWREVLSSIGLKVQRRRLDPYSFQDVKKELIAVKTTLGVIPNERQYLEIGKISLTAINRATKSRAWVDVIEKVFGISREDENCPRNGNYKSTKEYLEKLQKLAHTLGYTPSITEASKNGVNTKELTKRLKTNWLGVILAAKLNPKTLPDRSRVLLASKEDIIKDLRRVAKLIGKNPSENEYKLHGNYAISTVKGRLGSWLESQKMAGLPLESRYHDPQDTIFKPTEYYLGKLRELAEKLGRAPNTKEASKYGISTERLYERIKTDWVGILAIAGINYLSLPSRSLMRYLTNEQILEDISRVTALIGHLPSTTEYKKYGIYSPATIRNRFGAKWSNALNSINVDNLISKTSPDELIAKPTNLSLSTDITLLNSLEQESAKNVKEFFSRQKLLETSKK